MSSSSTVLDDLRWSEVALTMEEVVLNGTGSCRLPIVVTVVDGYCGCFGQSEIGADEMFLIYDMEKQKRILVKDKKNRFYSIPVDYRLRFHMLPADDKKTPAMSLKALVEVLPTSPHQLILLEDDQLISFHLAAERTTSGRLGVLEVMDAYELKYLQTRSISSHGIDNETTSIPVNMDVSFVMAVGCVEGNDDDFERWVAEVDAIGKSFEKKQVKLCEEIILFNHKPSGGEHYEFVRPRDIVMSQVEHSYEQIQSETVLSETAATTIIPSGELIRPEMPIPLPPLPRIRTPTRRENGGGLEISKNAKNSGNLIPPPPVPDRRAFSENGGGRQIHRPAPELPVEIPAESALPVQSEITGEGQFRASSSEENALQDCGDIISGGRRNGTDGITIAEDQFEMVNTGKPGGGRTGRRRSKLEFDSAGDPAVDIQSSLERRRRTISPSGPQASSRSQSNASDIFSATDSTNLGLPVAYSTLEAPRPATAAELHTLAVIHEPASMSMSCDELRSRYLFASDVPTDVDIAKLSRSDVAHCLCLLDLWQFGIVFEELDVDGRILLELDERILVDDFRFSFDDARKLMRFAKEKWRPTPNERS